LILCSMRFSSELDENDLQNIGLRLASVGVAGAGDGDGRGIARISARYARAVGPRSRRHERACTPCVPGEHLAVSTFSDDEESVVETLSLFTACHVFLR
jgi:hypothetical protein